MLRDAAGFAGGYVGFADGVEQRSLAVVDVAHDGDHGSAGNLELVGVGGFENFFDGLVGELFFVADDGGRRAKLGGDVLHHLGVERLVDGDEDAAHEQHGDQVLGADLEFFGQVLYADALGHGDFTGDGQRLGAELWRTAETWRRHKALHRAFLGLGILLASATASGVAGALCARRFSRRWSCAGSAAEAGACAAESAWARRAAEAGTCAEAGTPAWAAGTAGSCETARSGARGMLGPRAAGELPGSA